MIIVIDDSEEDRFFLLRAIRKVQPETEVIEFTYAEEALEFLTAFPPPLGTRILLDLNIPRLDGFAFLDRLAAFPAIWHGRLSITMVTNSIDPRDEQRALQHPLLQNFLKKSDLKQRLGEILQQPLPAVTVKTAYRSP